MEREQIIEVLREERPDFSGNVPASRVTRWEQGTMDEWSTIVLRFARTVHPNDLPAAERFIAECRS